MTAPTFETLSPNAPLGRFDGIKRSYSANDVARLRGSIEIRHSLAEHAANRLWELVTGEGHVAALGAMTGGQAVQMVRAGLKAIYLSGWQVAADNNSYLSMYPDQSLYPVDSVPKVVERINNSFRRADQIQWQKGATPADSAGNCYHKWKFFGGQPARKDN